MWGLVSPQRCCTLFLYSLMILFTIMFDINIIVIVIFCQTRHYLWLIRALHATLLHRATCYTQCVTHASLSIFHQRGIPCYYWTLKEIMRETKSALLKRLCIFTNLLLEFLCQKCLNSNVAWKLFQGVEMVLFIGSIVYLFSHIFLKILSICHDVVL